MLYHYTIFTSPTPICLLSEDKVGEEGDVVLAGLLRSFTQPSDHGGVASGTGEQKKTSKVLSLVKTFLRQLKLRLGSRQLGQLLPLLFRLQQQDNQSINQSMFFIVG